MDKSIVKTAIAAKVSMYIQRGNGMCLATVVCLTRDNIDDKIHFTGWIERFCKGGKKPTFSDSKLLFTTAPVISIFGLSTFVIS